MPKSKANVRNIATVELSHVEHHFNGTFTLTLEGRTPKGGKIKIGAKIPFEEWPYIHDNLAVVYKKHRETMLRSMANMDAAFNFKP